MNISLGYGTIDTKILRIPDNYIKIDSIFKEKYLDIKTTQENGTIFTFKNNFEGMFEISIHYSGKNQFVGVSLNSTELRTDINCISNILFISSEHNCVHQKIHNFNKGDCFRIHTCGNIIESCFIYINGYLRENYY
jgi:hypothetical protein